MHKVQFRNDKEPEKIATFLTNVAIKFLTEKTLDSYKAIDFEPGGTPQRLFSQNKGALKFHYNGLPWLKPAWSWTTPGKLRFFVTAHDILAKRRACVKFEILDSGGLALVEAWYEGEAKELFEYLLEEYTAAYPESKAAVTNQGEQVPASVEQGEGMSDEFGVWKMSDAEVEERFVQEWGTIKLTETTETSATEAKRDALVAIYRRKYQGVQQAPAVSMSIPWTPVTQQLDTLTLANKETPKLRARRLGIRDEDKLARWDRIEGEYVLRYTQGKMAELEEKDEETIRKDIAAMKKHKEEFPNTWKVYGKKNS